MASETYTNAYLLTENYKTGGFTPVEQIAGQATITDPTGSTLRFGDPLTYTDPYNTITLLYDGTVTDGGREVGFAAVDPTTGNVYMFTDSTIPAGTNLVIDVADPTTICFVEGTRIATVEGERAVEALQAGDMLLTADGAVKAVKWIGRQTVGAGSSVPAYVMPIRIAAGALGENLPVRDLLVSPDHALLLDGTLVHARALVNGTTVTVERDMTQSFTYFHIEAEDHAMVLAEGVAAETFVDNASREGFDNYAEYRALHGEGATVTSLDLPRAKSPRQVSYALRTRLAA